jgi:hypothetical protein
LEILDGRNAETKRLNQLADPIVSGLVSPNSGAAPHAPSINNTATEQKSKPKNLRKLNQLDPEFFLFIRQLL